LDSAFGAQEEMSVVLVKPTVQDESVGALTLALLREHVKRPGSKPSTPVKPTVRRCDDVSRRLSEITVKQAFKDRLNCYPSVGLTDSQ